MRKLRQGRLSDLLKVTQLIRIWAQGTLVLESMFLVPEGLFVRDSGTSSGCALSSFEICGQVLRAESRKMTPSWPNHY